MNWQPGAYMGSRLPLNILSRHKIREETMRFYNINYLVLLKTKCFFINLKQFQTLSWIWSKLNHQPWACSEISRFSILHQHNILSQLSKGYPKKLSLKPTLSIWCFFANT